MVSTALSLEVYRMANRIVRKSVHVEAPTDSMRLMRRGEVAGLLGLSVIRIDQLSKIGVLRKVRFPGVSRSSGFVAAEVYDLLAKRQEAH